MRTILWLTACCLFATLACHGGEIQIKTADGQTLQGEHLSTKDGLVKLRTKYGVVSVAEKDIASLIAIKGEKTQPAEKVADETAPKTFAPVKVPNLSALAAQALAARPPKEPTKEQRQVIMRLVRNYSDSSDSSRVKIVKDLQRYGMMALPFIAPAYAQPWELEDRIALFEALAAPGQTLTAGAFAELHAAARSALEITTEEPPPPPPDYVSQRERQRPRTKAEWLKIAAGNVLRVESYAAGAGGPLNCLLLLEIYKKRYSSETENALLVSLKRDVERLAASANDATRSRSSWTGADRILLAEQVFPLLFRDNEELQALSQGLLKKILPSGYPDWDAPQEEWVAWWLEARERLAAK